MRTLMRVVAAGVLFFSVGCDRKEATFAPPTFAEERLKLTALELKLGEDAYRQPEAEAILRALAQVPKDSRDWPEAVKLADWLRAKRRLSEQATTPALPEKDTRTPSMGPIQMAGVAPTAKAEVLRAEDIKAGSRRDEMLTAFGDCLTRQTWFRGARGGASTELFHITPSCRARLSPRVFTVADDKVLSVALGNLDGVMTRNPSDNPPNGAGSREQ